MFLVCKCTGNITLHYLCLFRHWGDVAHPASPKYALVCRIWQKICVPVENVPIEFSVTVNIDWMFPA